MVVIKCYLSYFQYFNVLNEITTLEKAVLGMNRWGLAWSDISQMLWCSAMLMCSELYIIHIKNCCIQLDLICVLHYSLFCCVFQIFRWASSGLPQKRSSSRHLLSLVALARPAVSPWAEGCRPLWICLPHEEGWSLRQPLPLSEGGDTKWVQLIATWSKWLYLRQCFLPYDI